MKSDAVIITVIVFNIKMLTYHRVVSYTIILLKKNYEQMLIISFCY